MLLLESFLQRETLAEIMARWMVGKTQQGDVRQMKKLVNFNSYAIRFWLDHLASDLLKRLNGAEPRRIQVRNKGQIKDFVVDHPTYTSPRIEEMCGRYRRYPEDFYRETPIDGGIYVLEDSGKPRLVGCSRIKRFRRIAEKGSRRIVDFILSRIRADADALAEERARALGIPKNLLNTSPGQQAEEFAHAERRVIKRIKRGTIQADLRRIPIPDAAGIKIIVENSDYPRLLDVLKESGTCEVIEAEKHTGLYNAVNIRMRYRIPRDLLAECPPTGGYLRVFTFRGFDPATVSQEYREFLAESDDRVNVEVIASTFQEYLESEIGRCMHEERVLSQRAHPEYNSHLATNVRYFMDYVFGICRSPGLTEVDDIPVKLWVRYMPDTQEHLIRSLYVSDDYYFDTLSEPPQSALASVARKAAPAEPAGVPDARRA